jgi:hypothetical protein
LHGRPEKTMNGFESDKEAGGLASRPVVGSQTSQSIEWYAEGESRTVEVAGIQVTIRFIGRKGRRGRILIEAPAGAVFRTESESK